MNKKEQSRQTFDLQASKYDTTFYGKHARKIYPYLLNEIIRCYGEEVLDLGCGFRVIIVIEANSYVNIRSSRLLPKFKTKKINSWCAA